MDAAGVEALIAPEPCTDILETQPDGSCPALCARCACCAQPSVPQMVTTTVSVAIRQPLFDDYSCRIPRTVPTDIFHVPKTASLTV